MQARDSLLPVQRRALVALAGLEPRWTLTGGGALAGFHLGHRLTRDVDLFFRDRSLLERLGEDAERLLKTHGFEVSRLVTTPAFVQLRVVNSGDVLVVDLVADPVAAIEPSLDAVIDEVHLAIDSLHEILVNKLCALLGRSEIRDLVDVGAILSSGGDLQRAVRDAPKKDAGFSALTLAWVLSRYPAAKLAPSYGLDADAMEKARATLEADLVALAKAESDR